MNRERYRSLLVAHQERAHETIRQILPELLTQADTLPNSRFVGQCEKILSDFVQNGGKRTRAALIFEAANLGGNRESAHDVSIAAASLEILQAALLIHDDIVDKADVRRGAPSAHRRLGSALAVSPEMATALGLFVGDLAHLLPLVACELMVDPYFKGFVVSQLLTTAITTIYGQILDSEMSSPSAALLETSKRLLTKTFDYKTAHYSVYAPIRIGLGRAWDDHDPALASVGRYSSYCGRALQMNDDLINVFGNESVAGKTLRSDLERPRATFVTDLLLTHAEGLDLSSIQFLLSKPVLGAQDIASFQRIADVYRVLEKGRAEVAAQVRMAQSEAALWYRWASSEAIEFFEAFPREATQFTTASSLE